MLFVDDTAVEIDVSTTASCNYVRFYATVKINGVEQKQYLKALKNLVA